MRDGTSLGEVALEFFEEVNWWDKLFSLIYVVVFGGLGILMLKGYIAYPQKASQLLESVLQSDEKYKAYFISFVIVTLTNLLTLLVFIFSDNGAVKLIKYSSYGHQRSDSFKIIGSILTLLIIITINIALFPMFAVIYIITFFIILAALASNNKK